MPLGQAVIDPVAIGDNIRLIAAETRTPLMAVVKANGFGHGAVTAAQAALASGATWLGVTSTAEAMELRYAGITAPVLSWLHRANEEFADLIAANVDIGVSSLAHLHGVAEAAALTGRPAAVQLKVDVGLSRNGISGDDWPDLVTYARKREAEGSIVVRGLWSHLTNADVAGCPSVAQQVATFRDALQIAHSAGLTPDVVHLANSGAALAAPQSRFDLCRIGLAMYGVDPFWRDGESQRALRPAMTLRTSVVNVKRVPAGTGVSYGPDYVTDRPATLALIPLGYADGLPRAAEGRASVWLGGQWCPVVGRISMDQCVVNAGDLPVSLGDPVVVFGSGSSDGGRPPAVEDWAQWARTNPHEILTGIGARVARVTPQEALTR